jgi:RHS repeat-associated protein
VGYDGNDRIKSNAFKAANKDFATENLYYNGNDIKEVRLNDKTPVWEPQRRNVHMAISQAKTGPLIRNYNYDAFGLPASRTVNHSSKGTLQNFAYTFDYKTSNLTSREDRVRKTFEEFEYYGILNRLTGYDGSGGNHSRDYSLIEYDNKGNITELFDIGYLLYNDSSKPYAPSDFIPYDSRYENDYMRVDNIEYNSLQRPAKISGANGSVSYLYDADGKKKHMAVRDANNNIKYERYYLGGQYEIDIYPAKKIERLYLNGDAYSAPAVYEKDSGTGKESILYICRDYLGSITHIIDESGNIVEENGYSPWGRIRNPATLNPYKPYEARTLRLGRGFTGHEHISEFGLINMNARLYDPVIGRFLSPDPYVQAPFFSQNFNRYAYALNNPLKYTDPSGELFWLIPVAIGAYLGGSAVNNNFNPIKWDYNNWQTYAGIAVGGAAGYAGITVGGKFATSALAGGAGTINAGIAGGTVGGMLAGGISGAGMTAIMGGNFHDIMGNMTMGMAMGGIAGAFSGGVGAAIGDFSGVPGGAFKNGMYELGHSALTGGVTGLAGGAMMAAMKQDANYLWKGAAMGAAFSTGMAGLRIATLGAAFIPNSDIYCELENFGQVYRRGSIFMPKRSGITLGRNVAVRLTGDTDYDRYLLHHETGHLSQINEMGAAKFYGRTAREYIKYGLGNVYNMPGTLEYATDYYAFLRLGYYYNASGIRYSFP